MHWLPKLSHNFFREKFLKESTTVPARSRLCAGRSKRR